MIDENKISNRENNQRNTRVCILMWLFHMRNNEQHVRCWRLGRVWCACAVWCVSVRALCVMRACVVCLRARCTCAWCACVRGAIGPPGGSLLRSVHGQRSLCGVVSFGNRCLEPEQSCRSNIWIQCVVMTNKDAFLLNSFWYDNESSNGVNNNLSYLYFLNIYLNSGYCKIM